MPSHLMMINFELGETSPIRPNQEELMEDRQVIVIDEFNSTHWLWHGSKISEIARRAALIAIQSINRLGYEYKHLRIGANPSNTVIIRQEKLSDLTIQTHYNKLKSTLSKINMKDDYLAEVPEVLDTPVLPTESVKDIIPKTPMAPTSQPPPEVSGDMAVSNSVAEPVIKQRQEVEPHKEFFKETFDEAFTSVTTPPKPSSITDVVEEIQEIPVPVEIKIGLLYYSISQIFQELYIAAHKGIVAVEGERGTLTTFKVLDKEIELSNEFNFNGRMGEVLSIYRDQIKKYSKLIQRSR